MRFLATVLSVLVLTHAGLARPTDASDFPRVVPQDLHDYAQTKGCSPPADFYVMRFEVAPPYAYANLKKWAPGPLAAVLWCQPDIAVRTYKLVFRAGTGDIGLGSCKPEIPNQSHIGGLSLVARKNLSEFPFFQISDPKIQVLPSSTAATIAVKSEHDGVGSYYLCHAGEWFFRAFH